MNGGPPPGATSVWKEHKNPEGRPYWHNTITNATTWDKPLELRTELERAFEGSTWTEVKSGDKIYYWNKQTNETSWSLPEDVQKNLDKIKATQIPQRPPASSSTWAAGPSNFQSHPQRSFDRDDYQPLERRDRERDRETGFGGDRSGPTFVTATETTLFSNPEEGEAAFTKLLKKLGVQSDWLWPQAVRAGVKDPHWRAIPDPKEREEAFKKYCEDLRAQDKAKEQDRQVKLRSDFMSMLRSHPEITHYTRWKTALPMIENETVYRAAKDETERRALFEEYIITLKKSHAEKESEDRKSALDELVHLLQGLDLEPFTRWHAAEEKLENNERFSSEKFRSLSKVDVLETFERHIRQLQRESNDRVQAERRAQHRIERRNRDAFVKLLNELKASGKLKAGAKWKEIREYIHDDPRYTAMLGQHGSSPLDLFWDALEGEEVKFRTIRRYALEVLEHERFEVTTATSFEEFAQVMHTDKRTASLDEQSLQAIFSYVINKVKKREEEERRDSEYLERLAMDDFRSALKHLEPAISASDTWDIIRPRIEKTPEFRAIKSDATRESVFDKYIRRLKEKEKDRDRSRRDPRDRERDRDRDRDRRERDREYRNGHTDSHRRHRTRTRSPEHDPYAAERRQAQEDREARYRNNDSTGLSPPYRRRREDDRYEPPRQGGGDHYGRERREREAERERSYVSRADPRERSVSELDYGDGGGRPASTRRRRDSDESTAGRRESKRPRYSPRVDRRSRSPPPQSAPELPKEDPGLRSGSEEGEIEED